MKDPSEEYKKPEISEQLREAETSNQPPAAGSGKQDSLAAGQEKKVPDQSKQYKRLGLVFGLIAAGVLFCIFIANFVFMIQTAPYIASYMIRSPQTSDLEQLSGFGFNVFISGQRTLRFFCHKPVTMRRQEKMKLYTSNVQGFQQKLDIIYAHFPDDKADIEKHLDSIEIWDYDEIDTLLHDKTNDLYLLYVDVG